MQVIPIDRVVDKNNWKKWRAKEEEERAQGVADPKKLKNI
jgi:hypothetical protein